MYQKSLQFWRWFDKSTVRNNPVLFTTTIGSLCTFIVLLPQKVGNLSERGVTKLLWGLRHLSFEARLDALKLYCLSYRPARKLALSLCDRMAVASYEAFQTNDQQTAGSDETIGQEGQSTERAAVQSGNSSVLRGFEKTF